MYKKSKKIFINTSIYALISRAFNLPAMVQYHPFSISRMRAADSPSTKRTKSRKIARRNTGHVQTCGLSILYSTFYVVCPGLVRFLCLFVLFGFSGQAVSVLHTPTSCALLWLVPCPGSSLFYPRCTSREPGKPCTTMTVVSFLSSLLILPAITSLATHQSCVTIPSCPFLPVALSLYG